MTDPWFTAEAQPALRDLWAVFDARFDLVFRAVDRAAPERHPGAAAMHERLRAALVDGAWAPYESYLRAEGASYARRGLTFGVWHALVAAANRQLTPFLVAAYSAEPDRLAAAIRAMNDFGGRAITVLAESYIAEREAMSRESEAGTERARRQAEGRFARLSESGILGIVVGRLDRTVVEINDAALAMVGYSREEILGGAVNWADLTPPELRSLDERTLAELLQRGIGGTREKEYVHRDGHRVPVLVGSVMTEGTEGEVMSFILDLTERKRAEAAVDHLKAIRAGEELFRTLVDSVTDYAIFMLDPAGRIVTWNRGAERLKGYGPAEVLGKHFSLFYPSEDLARGNPAEELVVAARDGRSEVEGWRVRRDGTRFWANVVITAMKDSTGSVLGFAKVTRDLTAQRAAAEALEVANQELQAFSYSVAHDLRAPLRGMSGFARVLLETYGAKLDAEGRDWLEEILLNANKMGALIDALLSLARVTRSEVSPERVDVSAVAHDVLRRLAERDPARSVAVVVQPGLTAQMDGPLARSLLENLIGNAWKFTARVGQARIEVGGTDTPAGVTVFVRDNGAGFDMAYAAKLFTPFQRLHTVAEFPGTGIGLATAQRIVQRHGGRLSAEGVVDGGATFTFTLPRAAIGAPP